MTVKKKIEFYIRQKNIKGKEEVFNIEQKQIESLVIKTRK